jgi:hypothetical protein
VFSKAGTKDEAIERGTYDRWLKIVNDPRYIMQQEERSAAPQASVTLPVARAEDGPLIETRESPEEQQDREADVGEALTTAEEDATQFSGGGRLRGLVKALIPPPTSTSPAATKKKKPPKNRIKKDWSEVLQSPSGTAGAAGATTGMGQFPATYSSGGTSCSDFAIFNTGLAGTSSQPNVIAYNNLYSSCNSGTPTVYFSYNTSSGNTALGGSSGDTSVALSYDGTQFALVQNVPTAVAATGTATAGTAIPTSGATVTVGSAVYMWTTTASPTTPNQMSTSGLTSAYQIAQTFYAALTGSSANCPTSNSSCIGTGTMANTSVIATYAAPNSFVTVTASCGGGTCGNSVVWTDSGSGAQLTLSPSTGTLGGGAGTPTVGGGTLVIVRIGSGGTLAAPTAPTAVSSPSSYSTCTAPCMTSIQLNGSLISSSTGPTDTYSSPFYDYPTNTLWVGDDSGGLHQITNVFSNSSSPTTPAETTSSGWPVAVNTNASLGGPVFDPVNTTIFVGDYALTGNSVCQPGASTYIPCGYLYAVQQSSGTVTKSAELDYELGIADAPLLDSTVGEVYAFAGADSSMACNSGPCAAVYQFPVGFGSGASGTEAQVGAGYEFLLSGAFDNAYLTTNTGNLYVVGNTGPADNTLYQIPITSGAMGTSANTGPEVATNYDNGYYAAGQQVTEFYNTSNGNHDYIFLNVLAFGMPTTNFCGTTLSAAIGCIEGFDVTSGTVNSSSTPTGALPEEGGTSGIVIDNGVSGASNIYFSTLLNQSCSTSGGTGGCATQTTQAAP